MISKLFISLTCVLNAAFRYFTNGLCPLRGAIIERNNAGVRILIHSLSQRNKRMSYSLRQCKSPQTWFRNPRGRGLRGHGRVLARTETAHERC